jgi:hypothetical protein
MRSTTLGVLGLIALPLACASAPPAAGPSTPTPTTTTASSGAPASAAASVPGAIDLAAASAALAELDAASARDGGKLWGRPLSGPLLFVDPGTRQVVANRRDKNGKLRPRGDLFVGTLADNDMIANTAVEWQGERWTMVMWPVPEASARRTALLAHECFHRIQPELGLDAETPLNAHLDAMEGRLLLGLEWRALEDALGKSDRARKEAIADALGFRAARRARFSDAAVKENALEIAEGIAEYTGARIAEWSAKTVLESGQKRRAGEDGFVRSFAYVSGPLYGYLLDDAVPGWQKKVTKTTDLGQLLGDGAKVKPRGPREVEPALLRYGGAELRASEQRRHEERAKRIAGWRSELVDGPVLVVDIRDASGSFDPRRVFPIGEGEVVYTERGLRASWGKLEVTEGAILEDARSNEGRVSLAGANGDHTKGPHWTLTLEPGWTIAPGPRKGDVKVVRR